MRCIIYGAGGIGGTVGARLAQSGREVILIARGAHLAALQQNGLSFIAPDGRFSLQLPTVGHPSAIDWSSSDVVLLCVKSQHTYQALLDLRRVVHEDTPIVCLQNGVANEEMALRLFSHVYAVHVFLPASHLRPGEVIAYGHNPGGVLDVGRYPNGTDACSAALAAAFSAAGFSARDVPNIMRDKYAKLLSNLCNAMQVLVADFTSQQELIDGVTQEAIQCYRAAGIEWSTQEEITQRITEGLQSHEIEGHPRQGGSSWQSVARQTGDIEADYLNGEIVLLGRKFGVPTPINRVLQQMANELVAQHQTPQSIPLQELHRRIESAR
jgi:2-dehydropantoate 2-reductase